MAGKELRRRGGGGGFPVVGSEHHRLLSPAKFAHIFAYQLSIRPGSVQLRGHPVVQQRLGKLLLKLINDRQVEVRTAEALVQRNGLLVALNRPGPLLQVLENVPLKGEYLGAAGVIRREEEK